MLRMLPESSAEEAVCIDQLVSTPAAPLTSLQVKLPTYILVPVATTSQNQAEPDMCSTASKDCEYTVPAPGAKRLHNREKRKVVQRQEASFGMGCRRCFPPTDEPCLMHSPMIMDHPTIPKAYASLPSELYVAQKDVRLGAYHVGVFAKTAISHPTIFGPLVAPTKKNVSATEDCFALREKNGNKRSLHLFDLELDYLCNWMKFVRKAVDGDQQNVVAFCEKSNVYFATTKDIPADTELRFWYSGRYSKFMRKGNVGENAEYLHLPKHDENRNDSVTKTAERGLLDEILRELELPDGDTTTLTPTGIEFDPSPDHAVEDITNEAQVAKEMTSNISVKKISEKKKRSVQPKRVYSFACTSGCDLKFRTRKLRDIHCMRHREGECNEQVADCPECEFKAAALTDLLDHIDNLHNVASLPKKRSKKRRPENTRIGLYCCLYPECRYMFGMEEVRDLHALRHGGEESAAAGFIPECPECGLSEENLAELLSHVEDAHSLPKRSKKKRKHSEMAAKSCNLIRLWASCPDCGLQFRTRKLLNLHVLQHTDHSDLDSQKVRRCLAAGCSFSSEDMDELFRHIVERHAQKEGHYCARCNQVFTTLKRLELHIQRIHILAESEKRFECETCHKKFAEKSSFSRHLRMHAGPNFITCCLCTATFPSRTALYDHLVEIHAVDGLLSCTTCGSTFQTTSSVAVKGFRGHMRKHTEEGHFECEICRKVFNHVHKLSKHKISHSIQTNRNFMCECGKSFAREKNLRHHQKIVHKKGKSDQPTFAKREETNGENKDKGRAGYVPPQKFKSYTEFPYFCEECQQGFCRAGMLAYHFTVRHPERSLESVPQLVLSSTAVHLNPL